jgi:peptidoglycan/LPS O-acetylase OafA/YrhL
VTKQQRGYSLSEFEVPAQRDVSAPSALTANQGQHFAAVDGLRGIACLAVVAHHCYLHCGKFQWPIVNVAGQTTALSRFLYYGNGGVELFFIVSGFCLAYPLFNRPNTEPWRRWFLRRAYRILPPYYASALLFWGMFVLLRSHPFSIFGMTSPPTGELSGKGLFVCVTLLGTYLNPSYWTLVLEARWYLLFPLLIALWRRGGFALLLLGSLLACAAAHPLSVLTPRFNLATGNVLTFLPIFVSGMLVAHWTATQRTPRWVSRFSPWGLLASILLVGFTVPSDGSPALFSPAIPWGFLVFFALVSALSDSILSNIARLPVLVKVGTFSYSLYLIHEPIVHLAYAMIGQHQLTPGEQFFIYECGVLPVCVGIGYLFYRLVEHPLLRRSHLVFKRPPARAVVDPSPLQRI